MRGAATARARHLAAPSELSSGVAGGGSSWSPGPWVFSHSDLRGSRPGTPSLPETRAVLFKPLPCLECVPMWFLFFGTTINSIYKSSRIQVFVGSG